MIVIVDTGVGNIASVLNSINRLQQKATLTSDAEKIKRASHVIIPGVSCARPVMEQLNKCELDKVLIELKQPVLGICLGMQILFERSDEGQVRGLSLLPGSINRLPQITDLRVPHIGWNTVTQLRDCALFNGIANNSYFYFVHSYVAQISTYTTGVCNYGLEFSAVVEKQNFYGTQFHPERSGVNGLKLLNNFLEL